MATPVSDAPSKHPDSGSKTMSKLSAKFDRLSSNVSRLGTAVKTTLNPNHRHDEEWEQEVDAKIEKIRDGHRFRSFAGERDGGCFADGGSE
jgi:phospholipase D1/2